VRRGWRRPNNRLAPSQRDHAAALFMSIARTDDMRSRASRRRRFVEGQKKRSGRPFGTYWGTVGRTRTISTWAPRILDATIEMRRAWLSSISGVPFLVLGVRHKAADRGPSRIVILEWTFLKYMGSRTCGVQPRSGRNRPRASTGSSRLAQTSTQAFDCSSPHMIRPPFDAPCAERARLWVRLFLLRSADPAACGRGDRDHGRSETASAGSDQCTELRRPASDAKSPFDDVNSRLVLSPTPSQEGFGTIRSPQAGQSVHGIRIRKALRERGWLRKNGR
jgi:hypothetical protein